MSFAETTDGVVMLANGIDQMLTYRPDEDTLQPAGVPEATGAPTLSGEGEGGITGSYRAFVRFVNSRGEVGNPSTIGGPVALLNASRVVYQNLPIPPDSSVVRRQILRNTAGQFATFYVDIDTDDTTSTSLGSLRDDTVLRDQPTQPMLDSTGRPLFNRFNRPPSTPTVLVGHLGRVWGAGVQEYSEGSAAVTRGSAAVVGTGCRWRAPLVGRFFHHPSGFVSEVAAVTPGPQPEDPQRLTLLDAFPHAGDKFSAYAIRPERIADDSIYFSEAGLPEAWAADNVLEAKRDGDSLTALIPLQSFLYLARRRSMDRLTAQGDPRTDGYLFDGANRGCAGPRTFTVVDNIVYVLDERGVYRYGGGGKGIEPLSGPIQDFFRGDNRLGYRINWTQTRFFHTAFTRDDNVVRFFVTINGGGLPRFALAMDADTGRWWLEEYPVGIGHSAVAPLGRRAGTYSDAGPRLVLAGPAGRVYATAPGPDVAAGRPGVVLDAGATWVRLRTRGVTPPDTPVVIERGRGAGQMRAVAGVAADGRLLLARPWAVVPAPGDRAVLGGVGFRLLTHRLPFTPSDDQDGFSVTLDYEPRAGQTLRIDLVPDYTADAEPLLAPLGPIDADGLTAVAGELGVTVDSAGARGTAFVRADRHREVGTPGGRGAAVRVSGVSAGEPQAIYTMGVNGVAR